MNVSSFLEHWSIAENPFRAEEARHDPVFSRLGQGPTTHPDFEKIVGDLARPSTAVVFGEKGSGKTAIRLQLASRITEFNAGRRKDMVLLVPYDDLNPVLDRYVARMTPDGESDAKRIHKVLSKLRLVDHMDAILATATPRLIDVLIGEDEEAPADLWRQARKATPTIKRDLLLLQALYDRMEHAERRASTVRRRLGVGPSLDRFLWGGAGATLWVIPAACGIATFFVDTKWVTPLTIAMWATIGLWAIAAVKWFVVDRLLVARLAKKVSKQLRTVPRGRSALSRALWRLAPADRRREMLPLDSTDDVRYAMFERLRRAAGAMGFGGVLVVLDRLDEPTLISGDPDRMRTVVWPLMNNKFLQQEGVGFKLLLPIELRHELFRENSAFFQEARLDKQNMIERLLWTGATLYDLCNARLNACRPSSSSQLTLKDLFDEDVGRQDIVDALDQMHQPRDAFKLIYQCIAEHCSNVTEEQEAWQIPRLILETVRKQQSDRVQMFYRGVRPA